MKVAVTLVVVLAVVVGVVEVEGRRHQHHHDDDGNTVRIKTLIKWMCKLLTRLDLYPESLCGQYLRPQTTMPPPTTSDDSFTSITVTPPYTDYPHTYTTTPPPTTGYPATFTTTTTTPPTTVRQRSGQGSDYFSLALALTEQFPLNPDHPSGVDRAHRILKQSVEQEAGGEDPCLNILPGLLDASHMPPEYKAAAAHLFLEMCFVSTEIPASRHTSGILMRALQAKTTIKANTSPLDICGHSETLKHKTFASRIVGGKVTGSCDVIPWQVRVDSDMGMCGGSIISDRHVLTAAHCVNELTSPSQIRVVIGDYDKDTVEASETQLEVMNLTFHADFDPSNYENDIALLTLFSPIDLASNPCVKPVCRDPTFTPDTHMCTVSGWGTTSPQGEVSQELQMVQVLTVPGHKCRETFNIPSSYPTYLSAKDNQLCASKVSGGGDSCQGDSGGPLVCLHPETQQFVQVGLVSYGISCAVKGFPGVYSSLAAFHDWLEHNMAHSV